jgi:hypothetical protein
MFIPVILAQVPIDNELIKATPVPDDGKVIIFAVPSRPNSRVEVLSVSLVYNVIPIDASNVATGDLIFHDASADSDTVLLDDFDALSTNASLVANEAFTLWAGKQSMDAGDTLRIALTITTPDTAGLGGLITIAYRVQEWNGEI